MRNVKIDIKLGNPGFVITGESSDGVVSSYQKMLVTINTGIAKLDEDILLAMMKDTRWMGV